MAQILGTNLLILAFGFRNYVVGSAYAKTEAVQGAILAMMPARRIPLAPDLGRHSGLPLVVCLSCRLAGSGCDCARSSSLRRFAGPGCRVHVCPDIGWSSSAQRCASKRPTKILAALTTLVAVLALQTLFQGVYVVFREQRTAARIARSWRVSGQVGLLAALGSACWFTGFATAPVALVRVVGQVEVIFTLAFGRYLSSRALGPKRIVGAADSRGRCRPCFAWKFLGPAVWLPRQQ